jgi:hypothetical protein
MLIEALNSYERQASLGGLAGREATMKRVDAVAQRILDERILNPSTPAEKAAVTARAMYLVNTLGGQGEFKADSVTGLQSVLVDSQKTDRQREIAEERLNILSSSVFIMMRYGGDKGLTDRLGQGPKAVEDALPLAFKGLGERVVAHIITDQKILDVLRDLDKQRVTLERIGSAGKRRLAIKVSEATDKVMDLLEDSSVDQEQVVMVAAYLNTEMEARVATGSVEQSKGTSTENQKLVDSIDALVGVLNGGRAGERAGGTRQMPMAAKGVDPAQQGAFVDGQNAVETIPLPVGCSHEEVSKWAYSVTDSMARGSLFWAGQGWQQVGPYLDRQLFEIFKTDKSPGMETRFAEEKKFVQALMACRIQEQAILHCDGTPSRQ